MKNLHIWDYLNKLKHWWQNIPLAKRMFGLMVAIYFCTRLVGLTQYPIYFFGDEAVQVNRAADLIRDKGFGYDEVFLPTFFENNMSYILGTSVYIQVLPYLLFGRSAWAARFAPMLISTLAAVWVSFTLKNVFEIKQWWVGGFLLSITPAWFLHSRTAFETVLFVTFYAGFLYHYLMYRKGYTRHLLWSLFWGAVAFYSYTAGQIIMVVSGILLFLFNLKYHWEHRKLWPSALVVLVVCVLPFVRFMMLHPEEYTTRLVNYGSYWTSDATFWQKVWQYLQEYSRGRSVQYWFFPHEQDMFRHTMTGYGHIHWTTLPLMGLGIWRLWVDHRKDGLLVVILASALAAPSGAAAVQIGITRVLVTVIPVAISAGIGLVWLIDWLQNRFVSQRRDLVARIVFMALAAFNGYMVWDALTNGPTWSTDYGLHGMQWGAAEVFADVERFREEDPEVHIDLSPNWANNFNELEIFFLGEEDLQHTSRNSLEGYRTERRLLTDKTIVLLSKDEYNNLREDPALFTDIRIVDTIMAPDMSIAFFWVNMRYSDEAEALFAAIEEERRKPMADTLVIDGVEVPATHSYLDMGQFSQLVDGNLDNPIRSGGANPLVITFDFIEPKSMNSIAFLIGSGSARLQLKVVDIDGYVFESDQSFEHVQDLRWALVDFGQTLLVDTLAMQLWNADEGEPSNVHVWEMVLNTPQEELP
ncbi:MAG: glycosyltransferase family 39 protein [Anaerolineae bacterium]|jgi:hypothetical protein|nr:glycosyltransferase family 39 protein [Anaerolineae bacterium]